jgi:hypothetical protein
MHDAKAMMVSAGALQKVLLKNFAATFAHRGEA